MARTNCTDCGRRPIDPSNGRDIKLCTICYDYAGDENTHSDWGHDELAATDRGTMPDGFVNMTVEQADAERDAMKLCPVCDPTLDRRNEVPRAGHHNTAPHSWTSHAGHNHPKTPKARAECRKLGAHGVDEIEEI
jgi:hypothetical protein